MNLTDYQTYIHQSRYARYRDDLGRRETWTETVTRYCDFFKEKYGTMFPYQDIFDAIHEMHVMPSMRALMTAGEALERDHVAGYNCSYLPIDHPRAFDEAMYILLCGTGVGFSVERQYVANLPEVPEHIHKSDTKIVVADSKIGWASAFRELVSLLYAGKYPRWDLSRIRPAGARLKTFGGRASGPDPLDALFDFSCALFSRAVGRRLNSVEVHDLVCKVADVVVVGGVRRSALISLSNLTDERMQRAKMGQWWEADPQRALANNSVAYTEKPDVGIFMREWQALYESKSGERGIFNRISAKRAAAATGRRKADRDFGTNPCGEIILRPNGFCNLSEIIVRSDDNFGNLKDKVTLATAIGTFQSGLTNFRYLRPVWKHNAEEERLLGVSMTGILDNHLLYANPHLEKQLEEMRDHAITTNKAIADGLGFAQSVSITTVKPSGTVSQLVDSASGIHPRYSRHYMRTVRADKKDPLALFLRSQGVPVEDDVTKPGNTDVFSFPVRAPEGSLLRDDLSALDQLEHYLVFKRHWCEHNPSITVYVREHEWLDVQAWVYKHFDEIGGVSFLPHSDHTYRQAPYQELTEEEYEKAAAAMPKIRWEDFRESADNTTSSQEMACIGGTCEVNL
jgi:ribonucleoside-diphosphate reductase alpha chain